MGRPAPVRGGGRPPLGSRQGRPPTPPAGAWFLRPARNALLVVLLLVPLIPQGLAAQAEFRDTTLQGELWLPFQPLLPGELEKRVPDEAKLDALLEEMVQTFSGMVYGWSFRYRPAAPERGAAEILEVKPLGRIVGTTGDPLTARALATQTWMGEDDTLHVQFRYYLTPAEALRRQAWGASNLETAEGMGSALTADRLESRLAALDQALKEAVRALVRTKVYNKPQEIRGEAALRQVPRTALRQGRYFTTAKFQIRVTAVREYGGY